MAFFFWLLLAVLVAGYANSKGRSGIVFFLLSIVFSPLIGFVIALALSPNSQALEKRALATGEFRKCPACAELVKIDARICKHCRSEV